MQKIILKRPFKLRISSNEVIEIPPGTHEVEDSIAGKAVRWGGAVIVKRKAMKNAPENKSRVGRASGGSRSARAKSDG